MGKSERFGLVLSPNEKHTLYQLAEIEKISASAVIRRLIFKEALCKLGNRQVVLHRTPLRGKQDG